MGRVLCLTSASLPGVFLDAPGFLTATEATAGLFLSSRFVLEERTDKLEEDELRRQAIVYPILMRNDGKVFVYRRTAGDPRLVGRLSVGFGGHVEEEDNIFRNDSVKPNDWKTRMIRKAASRELKEEASLDVSPRDFELIGFIASEATPVDRVHLGVVYLACPGQHDVVVCRDGCASEGWHDPEDLDPGDFESWSGLVLRDYFGVRGRVVAGP